jgi:Toastrack DUF4097
MRRRDGIWMVAVAALIAGIFITPRLTGARGIDLGFLGDGLLDRGVEALRGQESQDQFRWSGRLASGDVLEIRGVNGPIEAVATGGSEVVVVAEKSARRSDPAGVRIEVVEHDQGVTLCAVYPSRGDRNGCEAGEGWSSSVRNNDVRVAFRVEVPAGVELRAHTVNGDVTASGLSGDVSARTVNGDIDISTSGLARATTVNGSIQATMGRWDAVGADFETVNGSIVVDVPDGLDANVEARWMNGRLDTDLPLRVQGRLGRRSASAVLGEGGGELRLVTVNGSIRIR